MTELERYQQWCEQAPLDEAGRAALAAMQNDETERKGCFGAELQFGTAGIRGIMGIGTNRLNDYHRSPHGAGPCRMADLARSCRSAAPSAMTPGTTPAAMRSCAPWRLRSAACMSMSITSWRPTPMLSFAVRQLGCGCGIVVSASHNARRLQRHQVLRPGRLPDDGRAGGGACMPKIEEIPYFVPAKQSFEDYPCGRRRGIHRAGALGATTIETVLGRAP